MTRPPRFDRLLRCGVVVLTLAVAGTAWGNGDEFFAPEGVGKVDLVFFGRVKDRKTGLPVHAYAYLTIAENSTGMTFPVMSGPDGQYRSPDVGAAIKEFGEVFDPGRFEILCAVPGYHHVTATQMPMRMGNIEVNFTAEPLETVEGVAYVKPSDSVRTPDRKPNVMTWYVLAGCAVLGVIGAVERTAGRRTSTGD